MGNFFLVQNLLCVMIILAQIYGCRSCLEKERQGLLELMAFVNSLTEFDFNNFREWSNDTKSDCCRWERIKCDLTSGHVIGLSLNTSMYSRNWNQRPLLNLSLLDPFEELQSLDLSFNDFGGWYDNIEGYKSLRRLRKLKILDLSYNGVNNSILPFLKAAASLQTLILRGNYMIDPFPIKELKHLNKLETLDLSRNKFSGSLEMQGICELKNLLELDLSRNKFTGQLPLCVSSMTELRALDLSSNQLSGKLPPVFNSLESLEYLSLSDNGFEGLFSFSLIANLSKLKAFELSSTSNLLHLDTENYWQPKFELSVITLPYCNLEKVPSFLLYQKKLRLIDLSNNRLSGVFPSWLLENNPELEVLLLQNNSYTLLELPGSVHNLHVLDVSANDFDDLLPGNIGRILPNLRHMNLSKNGFQGNLPSSLEKMKSLTFLDLSHNHFSGKLPRSFIMGCYSLIISKLSHNNFSGQIFPRSTNLTQLFVLKMDNNRFTGKIGDGFLSLSLTVLDISNNFLTGAIPRWMGNFTFLSMLSMSNNFLEGTIPSSLFDNPGLGLLDLSSNFLSGTLPPHLNSERGVLVYLSNNNLMGSIPDTLLENITILDLRNNKLSGSIPQFVNTKNISGLLLRKNKLTGHIPRQLCHLSNIKVLDLAYNRLNGSIPSCLNNISFGSGEDSDISGYISGTIPFSDNDLGKYHGSLLLPDELDLDYSTNWNAEIEFAAKRRYDSYAGGSLYFMFGLDFSSNELSGEIRAELGDLQKLRALNLSQNNMSGFIPESFSGMKDMESLDLSFNRLYGQIPPLLNKLDYLVIFNVSYNNMSGPVPRGRKFDTLDESNYIGNPLLCGAPTNRSCGAESTETPDYGRTDNGTAIDTVVFYWSLAATYVTVLMGILVFLCFDSPWRQAWLRLVDTFICSVKSMWS